MNRISRLIVLLCIYASLFIGCFSLITYYNEVYLIENPLYQFVIAIVALVIALVLIVIQFTIKKKNKTVDVEEMEEELLKEDLEDFSLNDEEILDDNYEFVDSMEIEFMNFENLQDNKKENDDNQETITSENQDDYTKQQELIIIDDQDETVEKEKNVIDVLHDTLSMKKITEDSKETTTEKLTENEVIEKEIVHLEKVAEDIITEEVDAKVDLTDTQMMYIEQSKSSYLNTQGLPQLVVTDQVDSKDVKKANQIYQEIEKQQIIEKNTLEVLEREELLYLQEEKEERIISILSFMVFVLILANIALVVYFFVSRM